MAVSRRELNKAKCRKRILKASRRLFSQKVYEDTKIEDIAAKAEVSKATVYNYFPNKESLLVGIADEVLERVADLIANDLSGYTDSLQKLRHVLEVFVQACVDYLSLSRRITYLNSCEESALFATRCEMTDVFYRLIVAAQQEGRLQSDANADDIVDVVMGIYLIAQFQWSHIDQYTPEILHRKLSRFFDVMLGAYFTPPAPLAGNDEAKARRPVF